MPLCVQDLITSTDWVSAHILHKLLILISNSFKEKKRKRKYTGSTVIQMVQFYGLFMWFADECFYYCSFTKGFPSSKTSSTETLLTWATVTVSVHFYYNNKTLHAVTSRWLPSSRQTCSRRRFPAPFWASVLLREPWFGCSVITTRSFYLWFPFHLWLCLSWNSIEFWVNLSWWGSSQQINRSVWNIQSL